MTGRQFHRTLALAVVLGGFALRLYRLGLDSLWYDETVSLFLARSNLAELVRHTAGDIHPPLYYLLLHFWGQFVGWSEFASEYFSLCFGVLLIALVYRFALRLFSAPVYGERLGLLSALLVATSPYNVWYSQEVRMYTLGALLGMASVYFLLEMLRSGRIRSSSFLGYVVVTALGLYTLYYFIFLLIFEYVSVAAWLVKTRLRLQTFVISQFALVVLYLPWLPVALRQAVDPPVPPWRSFVPFPNMLAESFSALALGQSIDPYIAAPLLALIAALIGLLIIRAFLSRSSALSPQSSVLVFYTLVPLVAIFLFSLWKPLYHVRYIFTYSPAFYILLAVSIYGAAEQAAQLRSVLRPILAGAMLVVIMLASGYSLSNFWLDPRYADDDLRGAVQHMADRWRPGDVLLVDAGYAYPALMYYYPTPLGQQLRLTDYQPHADDALAAPILLETGSLDGSPRLGWGDPQSDFYATTTSETEAALDRVFEAHPRVWMLRIYDTVVDPDGVIRRYLAEHGRLMDDQLYDGESNARVQGYLTQRLLSLPTGASPSDAQLEGRLALMGYESAVSARAGENLDVVLYWKALQSMNHNYQLSVQLLGGDGQLVAQEDETPLGDALPTSRWETDEIYREPVRVALPPSLPRGEYKVIVKLYELGTGQVFGQPVSLAPVTIAP